jgi:hypothetical protein
MNKEFQISTDQKVLGLNPNAVTQNRRGFQEIEALFYFQHLHTIYVREFLTNSQWRY